LLNIERYERVESCTPKFQTASLPGLKVLIYNQTDMPISSLDGVNVPPGFTLDIPFRIQHVYPFFISYHFPPSPSIVVSASKIPGHGLRGGQSIGGTIAIQRKRAQLCVAKVPRGD
jgi:hypothetical protein